MPDDAQDQPIPPIDGPLKTSLSRGWVIKSLLIVAVFIGLAIWGYLDATIIYPARGQKHVDHTRLGYLVKLEETNRLRPREADVRDPAREHTRLAEQLSSFTEDSPELARYKWLDSLEKIENLETLARENEAELARREAGESAQDTKTLFANPREHLNELRAEIGQTSQPKPLNTWDIPAQWGFVIVGLGVGVPLLLMFLVNASKSFRYVPASKTLTLADGTEITPEKLNGFDKRKWDKFLVFVTLSGENTERKIDLYRYTPLEDWLVEIYEASPIYEAEDEEEARPAEESHDEGSEADGGG